MPFPIEEKYITKTESDLQLSFPKAFKTHMMHTNGGEIITDEWAFDLFPFLDTSCRKRISRTSNHIGLETKKAREWRGFPANGIAIGSDGFGNLLILMHDGSGILTDDLYVWDHEMGTTKKIAASIQELME
ncbi:MAG: SMI1/KNR4 family protein [Bacteroidota bacterium]